MSFDVRTTVRSPLPRIPFQDIAQLVLGNKYELSLVICGDTLAQRMNREYRKKDYVPNVLSFPLSKTEGEIFLNVRKAEQEAKKYGVPIRERITYLFVHACAHLKGHDHSPAMDHLEVRIMKRLGF